DTLHFNSFPTRRSSDLEVEVTSVLSGSADGLFGHLVEHHAAHRHLRLERLQQVPRDGLALPVRVGGQVQLVDVLQQALQLTDRRLLVRRDDVERLRSEEHTSELQSRENLVCRLLLEKKKQDYD